MEGEQVRKYRVISKHNAVATYPAFGLRGRQERQDMKVDGFQVCKDDDGVEFVQFTEGQTKTQQGGLHIKHCDFQPRMLAVG